METGTDFLPAIGLNTDPYHFKPIGDRAQGIPGTGYFQGRRATPYSAATAWLSRFKATSSLARVQAILSLAKPDPSVPNECPCVTAHFAFLLRKAVRCSGLKANLLKFNQNVNGAGVEGQVFAFDFRQPGPCANRIALCRADSASHHWFLQTPVLQACTL